MTVFQIDDGWQKVWGDWTAGFPRGMETLATEIKKQDLMWTVAAHLCSTV